MFVRHMIHTLSFLSFACILGATKMAESGVGVLIHLIYITISFVMTSRYFRSSRTAVCVILDISIRRCFSINVRLPLCITDKWNDRIINYNRVNNENK